MTELRLREVIAYTVEYSNGERGVQIEAGQDSTFYTENVQTIKELGTWLLKAAEYLENKNVANLD